MQTRFRIVWQPSSAEASIVLRSVADANEATIAFDEELARLRTQEATGTLRMHTGDGARAPLLWQSLRDDLSGAPDGADGAARGEPPAGD